jgi:hypothetical protein
MLDVGKGKPKSFWKRPEGITGTVFLIGIVVILALFWSAISAWVISLLSSLITAIALFVGLAVIVYILLDKKFRTLIWYMYQTAMRAITGMFVQIDPIKILEAYVEYLYQNKKMMNEHIAKLRGQIHKMDRIIEENKKEMETNLRMAEQAKAKGNVEAVAINTRQFGRLKDANERYNTLKGKMEILYRVLSKIHKNSGYLIEDIENEVRMRKQEMSAIKAGHSAMRRAMNIINGDPDKKMIFDMAMETIVEDVSSKIGEMERFIEVSGSFIDSVDLQNGVYEQEGLALLEKMESEGMSFLLGDHDMDKITNTKKTEETKTSDKDLGNISSYSDLFS